MDLRNPSRIVAGGAVFGTGPPIVVDGAPLFEVVLSDGVACINAKFSDEAGRTVVEIRENELLVQHGSWDATFIGTQFVVRCAPGKIAFECIMHPPHGLYLRSIDFARPPYRVLSDETGFNLFNQNGKITDLKAGYVWALGGSVEMAADRFQVLGGLGLVPYPVERFVRLARAGQIEQLVAEVMAPLVHVAPALEGAGYRVEINMPNGDRLVPSTGATEAEALAIAQDVARALSGRTIFHAVDGSFRCLFQN